MVNRLPRDSNCCFMHYKQVCIEAFGYSLPSEIITSDAIESRLEPLYERLRLPTGRLELMTGIRERRLWPDGMLPSEASIISAQRAIEAADFPKEEIGCLIHASVCRDYLEPATACRVHHELGLPDECVIYDVSNACLGVLNGAVQIANMIELGQIKAGIVVGTESSRSLLEDTIEQLNHDTTLTRQSIKLAVASLTIGSGSCAILLTNEVLSQTGNQLVAATAHTNTQHHKLCHSHGMQTLMQTDSEQLLHAGIGAGRATFERFLNDTGWSRDELDRTFCHQVGESHRKLMLEALELPVHNDFKTLNWLGNT